MIAGDLTGHNVMKAKRKAFKLFRRSGEVASVSVLETGHIMTQALFNRIRDIHTEFDGEV